jgi:hypothetical protein
MGWREGSGLMTGGEVTTLVELSIWQHRREGGMLKHESRCPPFFLKFAITPKKVSPIS